MADISDRYIFTGTLTVFPYHSATQANRFAQRNLLLTPFAPFFVLFCYVIETASLDDLRLLQEFVDSLDEARDASETIEKLHRLCQVMCDVAGLYAEAKSQQQEDQTMAPIGDEFEMYLSQLGFMPSEDQTMANTNPASGPPTLSGQAAQIADWFSGNRNMMGLLEEDLSHIDSYRWMQQQAQQQQQQQQQVVPPPQPNSM